MTDENTTPAPHFSEKVGDTPFIKGDKSSVPIDIGTPPFAREESEKEETRIYEIGYLILPTIPEADVPREVTAFKDALEREKAAVIAEEFPKFRALAYGMQKRAGGGNETYANGYFGWVKFETSPKSAQRIEEELKRNERMLRFILIKTVRESTLLASRPRPEFRREARAPQKTVAPAPTPVSEAELEKAMEKLIAE